jgi:hypothetical protein
MDWATWSSELWEFFLGQARASTAVGVFGFILMIIFLWLFARAERTESSPISIPDLFIDPTTGKMTRRALGELVGLFVSTLGLFYFLASDTIGESTKLFAFMFYSLLWVARSLLGALIQTRFGGNAPMPERDEPTGELSLKMPLSGGTATVTKSSVQPTRRPLGKPTPQGAME